MKLPIIIARQLAKPVGILGRIILWRLEKTNRNMNTCTLNALAIDTEDRILEIGFGSGMLLEEIILKKPKQVVGTEISDLALIKTNKRLANSIQNNNLQLVSVKNTEIPFESCSFSKACCVNIVYFWKDIVASMAEVHRVLEINGRFVLCYQDVGPNGRKTPSELIERSLKLSGFEIISTQRKHDSYNDDYFCTIAQKQEDK